MKKQIATAGTALSLVAALMSSADSQGTNGAALIPPTPTPFSQPTAVPTQADGAVIVRKETGGLNPVNTVVAPTQTPEATETVNYGSISIDAGVGQAAYAALPISADDIIRTRDFQQGLNTPRSVDVDGDGDIDKNLPELAGYGYGYNDAGYQGETVDGEKGNIEIQIPMYAWTVLTGQEVKVPGVGEVVGGDNTAAMIVIINRTGDVISTPENSVQILNGFLGTGRIWHGELNLDFTEEGLVAHYTGNLMFGHPESGFVGQCDSAQNCNSVNVLTVEILAFSDGTDGLEAGTPIVNLIRSQTIKASDLFPAGKPDNLEG